MPWVESLLYSHLNLPKLFKSEFGSIWLEASIQWLRGEDAKAVPVGGSPQRPDWVCTEDLEGGSGSLSTAGFVITSHTPSSVFGVAKLQRLWEEKVQFLTEFESPQTRG